VGKAAAGAGSVRRAFGGTSAFSYPCTAEYDQQLAKQCSNGRGLWPRVRPASAANGQPVFQGEIKCHQLQGRSR
jgi:hypothetical protein